MPEEERYTLPEEYLRDRLAVMLGGRTSERELLGSVSSGADDDIRQATSLARAMVSRWGMSKEIGPVDRAVRKLLTEAEKRAMDVIHNHRPQLEKLITALEKHETLYRDQIEQYLGDNGKKNNNAAEIKGTADEHA